MEVLPVEANRDADLQDAVKNAAVIQIVQNEEVGAHKRFHVVVAVCAEVALHTVDHIGHSHKEDRLQTVNQSVGNAASGIGFSRADIPEQE